MVSFFNYMMLYNAAQQSDSFQDFVSDNFKKILYSIESEFNIKQYLKDVYSISTAENPKDVIFSILKRKAVQLTLSELSDDLCIVYSTIKNWRTKTQCTEPVMILLGFFSLNCEYKSSYTDEVKSLKKIKHSQHDFSFILNMSGMNIKQFGLLYKFTYRRIQNWLHDCPCPEHIAILLVYTLIH